MKVRSTLLLAVVTALMAALIAATPAEAARYYSFVKSSHVAISSGGNGKVAISCHSSKGCRGSISFADDTGKPRTRSYKVSGKRTSYVKVAIHGNASDNPHNAPAVPGRDIKSVTGVRLKINEDSPRNITHYYNVTAETYLSRQSITGSVVGQNDIASDIIVELVSVLKGGNTKLRRSARVSDGGNFTFGVSLGPNNSRSAAYRLRITGKDQDGNRRSWWWRGSDGNMTGGGAYLRDASVIRADKYDNFNADFRYGTIAGTAASGAEVTVASSPPSYSGNSATLRDLDYQRCANIFGQTKANGSYKVIFLPLSATTANRYMLGVRNGPTEAWYGAGSKRYGSCYDVTNYKTSRSNLIKLPTSLTGKDLPSGSSNNTIKINGVFSSSYKPTSQGDRWIRLRERIPGLKILQSPVAREHRADSSGNYTFTNVAPGHYWVEVGRRTGCSDWYPSRYTNNRAYFKGEDRASERWKSFTKLSHLSGNANRGYERIARRVQPNPATISEQNKIRSGYKGWMYRAHCKAYGAGTINRMDVNGTERKFTKTTSRNPKGAMVKGHVSRTKGRTNKEMLVRLSSSAGTRVVRTAYTDGKGNFRIAGLASGTWTVSVNSDSWRGIGRSFSGKHSIKVKSGHGYNIHTLRFKG